MWKSVVILNLSDSLLINKLWKESLNSDGPQFQQYQQNEQSPFTSTYWMLLSVMINRFNPFCLILSFFLSFRPGQVSWSFSLILAMFTFFRFSLCHISNSVCVKQRSTFRHVTTFRNITQRMRQCLLALTPKYCRKQTWTYCPVSEQGSLCCHSLMMCT